LSIGDRGDRLGKSTYASGRRGIAAAGPFSGKIVFASVHFEIMARDNLTL
jgi:hypothetical protein